MAWEGLQDVHEPPEIEQALRDKLADETASPEERSAALVALAHEAEDNEELRQRIADFFARPRHARPGRQGHVALRRPALREVDQAGAR